MPLVDMRDMLNHAYHNGYAVGNFELVSLDFLEVIITAAEATRSPVILSLDELHFEYYDFELVMVATELAAKRASIPVAIHLDHGVSYDSAVRAINTGCNGVMVDASHVSISDNVATMKKVVNMAHACGVPVEGVPVEGVPVEGVPGYVIGVESESGEKQWNDDVHTLTAEVQSYVEQTGIDFLSISISAAPGRMQGQPSVDIERLKKINELLNIPLVIHGDTSLSDAQFKDLIANGVAKVNYYTSVADVAGETIRDNVVANSAGDYTSIVQDIRDAKRTEVERCMMICGSIGQADKVMAHSAHWQPVHHVIIFNVEKTSDADAQKIMREGESILRKIPGVRRVNTGTAITENAKYRFAWLVEFVHEKVINSYRDHPDHVAFADNLFRPIAGDRISIDYRQNN